MSLHSGVPWSEKRENRMDLKPPQNINARIDYEIFLVAAAQYIFLVPSYQFKARQYPVPRSVLVTASPGMNLNDLMSGEPLLTD